MRKKGENNIRRAGKIAIRSMKIMISPLGIESQAFPLMSIPETLAIPKCAHSEGMYLFIGDLQ
jgi:hypothetical protein